MDKNLFIEMSLELKGDYVFKTGKFVATREYGFYQLALYKCKDFYCEVHMDKKNDLKIFDIAVFEDLFIYKI